MPVYVIDTLKPKNGLDFPVVEAIDVAVEGYSSLADAVTHFVTDAAISALTDALDGKADKTTTDSLQAQIDQIVISASAESVVAPEVAAARVDADGTTYQTLKSRLDADYTKLSSDIESVADILDVKNYIRDVTYIAGSINESGEIQPTANYHYTTLIALNEGVYSLKYTNSANVYENVRIHGYDAQGNWVSQITWSRESTGTYNVPFTVSESIKSIRISCSAVNITLDELRTQTSEIDKINLELVVTKNSVDKITDDVSDVKNALGFENILDGVEYTDGSINQYGSIDPENTRFHYTDLIPVSEGEYNLSAIANLTASDNFNMRVHSYSDSGEWLRQVTMYTFTSEDTNVVIPIELLKTDKKLRISTRKEGGSLVSLERANSTIDELSEEIQVNTDDINALTEKVYKELGDTTTFPSTYFDDKPIVFQGKEISIVVGENVYNVYKPNTPVLKSYIIDCKNYEQVTYPVFKSNGSTGSVFIDDNDIIVGGYGNSTIPSGTNITINIPPTASKFVLTVNSNWEDWSVTLTRKGEQADKTRPLDLHTIPANEGVLNAIKRARQLSDCSWTPVTNLTRTMMNTSDTYMTSHSDVYEGQFTAGKEYTGLPYSESIMIGIDVSFDAFFSSLTFEDSAEYELSSFQGAKASWYGMVCSALTCYAFDLPYVYSSYTYRIPGMTKQYDLITEGVRHDLSDLSLCDVLVIAGHCALVTDIITENNVITEIEITEATRQGNTNKSTVGGKTGGLVRRFTMTVDEFFEWFEGFSVYRYAYLNKVPYVKTKYSPMLDEKKPLAYYDFPCIPYEGNKFAYRTDNRTVTILINDTTYTHLAVYKDGVLFDTYEITGSSVEVPCDNEEARYKAKLVNINNGEIVLSSVSCDWYVVPDPTITITKANNVYTISAHFENGEFSPYYVSFDSNQTTHYGRITKIFSEDITISTDNGVTYTFTVPVGSEDSDVCMIGFHSDNYGMIVNTVNME